MFADPGAAFFPRLMMKWLGEDNDNVRRRRCNGAARAVEFFFVLRPLVSISFICPRDNMCVKIYNGG